MRRWTFLSNHAQVLLCIARDPSVTAREIGRQVGITERAAQNIIRDLEAAGYVTKQRQGRRNRYALHLDRPMRHPAQRGLTVRDLLEMLQDPRVTAAPSPDETVRPERPEA
ncbi:helix-turn-helix transcriptional regulator [Geochorda subterranea]|uniref:Winged helix-turn-helix domain-containing protein n=1 Tax=Geochorda subterranea TaxID=3109564 RepID=A0ABZ1BTH8_9FIRM|nr:winged helix-turn-helix domain-containing protein [Limnochorda sp. LNt]WRP15427.1 winged helix-turn-helix domain-containing protein [Limnochorda sp. LNt]